MVGGWPLTIADSMASISYGMYCIKLKGFREELIIMAGHCQDSTSTSTHGIVWYNKTLASTSPGKPWKVKLCTFVSFKLLLSWWLPDSK